MENTKEIFKVIQKTTGYQISNSYGGLIIMEYDNGFYWMIEDYDSNIHDIDQYEPIDEELFNLLKKRSKIIPIKN
jgi:hypothetical protein